MKISLPVETLDAARPALEDLRLYDDAGNEVPYLIERPVPIAESRAGGKIISSFAQRKHHGHHARNGSRAAARWRHARNVRAMDFIKAVRVESSDDGKRWQISRARPADFSSARRCKSSANFIPADLFKMAPHYRGRPALAAGSVHRRARPSRPPARPAPGELISAAITERDENPGETRLALSLGAANLSVASVQLETSEPLFMRQVSVAFPKMSEDSIREETIGQGTVYRVAVEGQTAF